MTDPVYGFNDEGKRQYEKIAREVTRRMMNETPHRGRWQRHIGISGQIKEGLCTACLSDGWYEIEEAEFADEPPGFLNSGIDGDEADCNICGAVEIDATVGSACEVATEVVIERTRPTGLGTFVYAHCASRIPIRVGGHVRMLPIHRAGNGEQLYCVVDAEFRMVKAPMPDWECCDGVVTLVGCSWVIHEGVVCDGWQSACPS